MKNSEYFSVRQCSTVFDRYFQIFQIFQNSHFCQLFKISHAILSSWASSLTNLSSALWSCNVELLYFRSGHKIGGELSECYGLEISKNRHFIAFQWWHFAVIFCRSIDFEALKATIYCSMLSLSIASLKFHFHLKLIEHYVVKLLIFCEIADSFDRFWQILTEVDRVWQISTVFVRFRQFSTDFMRCQSCMKTENSTFHAH
jgi:hypothetical protein